MFRFRLSLAFAALVALVCVQAAFVYWGANRVHAYAQHSRLASDILSELLTLSANKQRLRVWASQQLMNADASAELRDRLVADMQDSASKLTSLAKRDLEASNELTALDGTPIPPEVTQLVIVADLLDDNIVAVRSRLLQLHPLEHGTDFSAVWGQLNQVFDTARGRDLRELVNGSIERQRQAVPIARAATERGLDALRRQAIGMVLVTLLTAVVLAWRLRRRLQQPLDRLLLGIHAVQAGDLGHRIVAGSRDEFDRVAEHFNAMAAELQQHRGTADAARRRLEEAVHARTAELSSAHDALQRVDARRRQLFADLSHELRTPATAIRGEAEIALRGVEKPAGEYKQALSRIVGGVKQLVGVIDDLMLVAKAEADQLTMRFDVVDLAALLGDTVEQVRALGALHDVHLHIDAPPEAGGQSVTVHADAERLRQAVVIALDNAVRYSRRGGAVRLSWQTNGEQAFIHIVDQGIGIDPEELPVIFQRFVRGRRAREHRADGTGIGLSIAQSILRAHRGDIHIDSVPHHGTTVRMELPCRYIESAATSAERQ
jgi:signal transduction histidine kinase